MKSIRRVKWGVLGAANIAVRKVIPAMQLGEWSEIGAIASRDMEKARDIARQLGIPKAYGSYQALLEDQDIEAVYNPLPNHLHVRWSIQAMQAGKHVLCEKPLAMSRAQAAVLLQVRERTGMQIGEAFMVKSHPQWLRARQIIRSGQIGDLRTIHCLFNYFNRDPHSTRNSVHAGGGAMLDICCYPVTLSRFLFEAEPRRVAATMDRDPDFHTDRLTSAMLEFASGHATFTCSTQLVSYQRMQLVGTKGRIEMELPFSAPSDRGARLLIDDGRDYFGGGVTTETLPICDQYAVQGDAFSRAIRGHGPLPVPLEDSLANMTVLDALFRAAKSGCWMDLVPRQEGSAKGSRRSQR